MRRPAPEVLGGESDRLRVLPLDVTDPASIAALIDAAGPIDVLVNNAGIGGVGAFEAMPMSLIRQLIETNTIGVMAMCQAAIPQMRERGAGTIVNVTSSVALGEFLWRPPTPRPSGPWKGSRGRSPTSWAILGCA